MCSPTVQLTFYVQLINLAVDKKAVKMKLDILFFKLTEWICFLGLWCLSISLIWEVAYQYFSEDTNFKIYEEPIIEQPTITICFPYMLNVKDFLLGKINETYEYEEDFNIIHDFSYMENEKIVNKRDTNFQVEKIITYFSGICYKVTPPEFSYQHGKESMNMFNVNFKKVPFINYIVKRR